MNRNIYAYTAPGANFPEFISINDNDGKVEVTVRGPSGDAQAPTVLAELPEAELPKLIEALQEYNGRDLDV